MKDIARILPLYERAGLSTVEITMNSPDAEEIIRDIAVGHGGDLNIGAGTVCNLEDLDRALEAGAQFIVTPILDEQVIVSCVKSGIPVFPGAYTPSEIFKAWKLGASMVKVFPATALGPRYIKEIKAPLDMIKLMPTGGINLDNCADFLNAGADALGIGSQLFHKELINAENWKGLAAHFQIYTEKINTRIV